MSTMSTASSRASGDSCGESGGEVAVADDVAERGQVVVGAVDDGAAETVLLRDVDGFDRRRGARRPGLDPFEQLAGAVREGEGARVALLGLLRSTVQKQRFLAAGGERQMQRHADRAGADDQDVRADRGRRKGQEGRAVSHGA
jgi:hypothetical protein